MAIQREEEISEYYELRQVLKDKGEDFRSVITHPTYALPFIQAGRLVEIKDGDKDYGWGAVVAYSKAINPRVCQTDPPLRCSFREIRARLQKRKQSSFYIRVNLQSSQTKTHLKSSIS